jgi:hypothetical protein
VIGWLVDTNVIASLIAPDGAPGVKGWGSAVDERRLFISVLTLVEYDKGIANLAGDDPNVQRYIAARSLTRALLVPNIELRPLHACACSHARLSAPFRTIESHPRPGRMAYDGQARRTRQHHADLPAFPRPGAEPGRERLAVPPPEVKAWICWKLGAGLTLPAA